MSGREYRIALKTRIRHAMSTFTGISILNHIMKLTEVNEPIVGLPKSNSNLFLEHFRITFKTSHVNYQIVWPCMKIYFFLSDYTCFCIHASGIPGTCTYIVYIDKRVWLNRNLTFGIHRQCAVYKNKFFNPTYIWDNVLYV